MKSEAQKVPKQAKDIKDGVIMCVRLITRLLRLVGRLGTGKPV